MRPNPKKLAPPHQAQITHYSACFARAYAIFVKELLNGDHQEPCPAPRHELPSQAPWKSWPDLPESLRHTFETEIKQNNQALAQNQTEALDLKDDSLFVTATNNRLKQMLKQKGVTQRELASRLNVSPSFISKVLKNPERSTFKTLKAITQAIGLEMDIILR